MSRLVRGFMRLLAALALLAIVAGAPAALWLLTGNPLKVVDLFTGHTQLSDVQIIQLIAVLGWIAWLQFLPGVVLEALASMREDRPYARRVSAGQWLARTLIAAIITSAVLGSSGSRTATAAAAPAVAVSMSTPLAAAPTTALPAAPASTTALPSYVFGSENDVHSLWAIADRHLGDPLRWKEIADLNAGRLMNDGHTFDDQYDMHDGWVLLMPADATGLPTQSTASEHDVAAGSDVTVAPGDNLTKIAIDETGTPANTHALWEANAHRAEPQGQRFDDPDLIRPGWTLTIPAGLQTHPLTTTPTAPGPATSVPTPAPAIPLPATVPEAPAPSPAAAATPTPAQQSTPTEAAPHTTTAAPSSAATALPTQRHTDSTTEQHDLVQDALVVFAAAGGLFAAGYLGHLARRRRLQRRKRRYGRVAPTPSPAAADIEYAAYIAEAPVDVDWLDTALRTLAATVNAAQAPVPDVIAAYLRTDALELLLAAPAEPITPFLAGHHPDRWVLSRDTDLTGLDLEDAVPPLPALATLGYDQPDSDDRQLVLLDLEGIGSLAVDGDPSMAAGALRFLAADLLHNGWSVDVDVITVGLGQELEMFGPGRVHCLDDLGELHRYLLDDAPLRPAGDPLHERVHNEVGEEWAVPRIVLIDTYNTGITADQLTALLEELATAGRSLLSVVIAGDQPNAHWHAQLHYDGRLELPSLGHDVHIHTLTGDMLASMAENYVAATAEDQPAPPAADHQWAAGTDVLGALLNDAVERGETTTVPELPAQHDLDDAPVPDDETEINASADTSGGEVRSLRPELDRARHALAERESLDPDLDAHVALWFAEDTSAVKLSVLGPLSVHTAGTLNTGKISLQQAIEIVMFLAFSAIGRTAKDFQQYEVVNSDAIKGVHHALLEVRKWLSTDRNGQLFLPAADKSYSPARYVLSDEVLRDWLLLRRLRSRAQAREAAGYTDLAIADYRTALALVTGEPFSDRRLLGYRWLVYAGGVESQIAASIVDTAHDLALIGLRQHDQELVEYAARTAISADPYATSQQPYIDLMTYWRDAGNKDAFSRVVRDLLAVRSSNEDTILQDVDLDGDAAVLIRDFLGREGLRPVGS